MRPRRALPLRLGASPEENAPVGQAYWKARDVAAYLQVSVGWVWRQVRLNKGFPFFRIGERNVRFEKSAIDAWVRQRSPVDGAKQR